MSAGRMVSIVVLFLGATIVGVAMFDSPMNQLSSSSTSYNNDNTMRYIGALFGRQM